MNLQLYNSYRPELAQQKKGGFEYPLSTTLRKEHILSILVNVNPQPLSYLPFRDHLALKIWSFD